MHTLLAALALTLARVTTPADPQPLQLTLLTYNIRCATADDGPDAWSRRRELALGVIDRWDADAVGLQEALRSQLSEILDRFPHYALIGVGRDDGAAAGEHTAILYRHDRFAIDQSGTFWLSDTPDQVASATWGNTITRTCTWTRLVEHSTGRAVYIYNTHLDHLSQPARERSARLIARRIAQRTHPDPVALMGDFNAGESNPVITFLLDHAPDAPALTDTFRALHPDATDTGTFHAFRGTRDGDKIDHILTTPTATVLDAQIDHTNDSARYPSDHFPVVATVTFPPAQ